MAFEPLETAEGSDFPQCIQLTVFLENRLGQLLRLTRLFEQSEVHILGLSVEGATDCALCRILVDDPDFAQQMLVNAGFPVSAGEVIVVELPPGKRGIMAVAAALIAGEVNINYLYPLLTCSQRGACVALQVDNSAQACAVLSEKNFNILQQSDL